MKIFLHNSLTKQLEEFLPLDSNEVKMYSCGPTVYNHAHIGNMRAFLFADLLQRVLRVIGKYDVKWVMNITDIDDKTIRDSRLGSEAWKAEMGEQTDNPLENLQKLTEYYQDAFLDDISKLGIDIEHFYALPSATDYIEEMQVLILNIIEKGYAYISNGSVYFDVTKWRHDDVYGKLFKVDFDNFRPGSRVDSDEYEKESVSDFVLWKEKKENEPYWDFEINGINVPGRPGWHIECSAMEYELLGLPFDIHTGGVDLKFPHHEDEIAQSKAGYGFEPTNYWLHNEFLEVEGEKMSKSAGNFFTVVDLLDKGLDPSDIRFAMLSAHYRTKYNFTFSGVESQKKARKRIQDFIWSLIDESIPCGNLKSDVNNLKELVFTELANDLHTPKALAHIFTFINNTEVHELTNESKLELLSFFNEINHIFEVFNFETKPLETDIIPSDIIELAAERWNAKISRDFAKSDELRKILDEKGWIIKDAKDNYEIIRK
jgi:cysteinyl-tRNA synthetase